MSDPTEQLRKQRIDEINNEDNTRKSLEEKYPEVWNTSTLQRDFEVLGFMAPFVVVRKKDGSGVKGSLEFTDSPRYYFNFEPE